MISPPRGLLALLALAALASGCEEATEAPVDAAPLDAAVTESDICDGLDNDGDGLFDEGGCTETYACARIDCTCAPSHMHCGVLCVPRSTPETQCDNTCGMVDHDPRNCGACGNVCPPGNRCEGGRCLNCAEGVCDNRCVNLSSDPQNCGACGIACATGTPCVRGACRCPPNSWFCNGRCVDVYSDPRNCGVCGVECTVGSSCLSGRCVCPTGQGLCGSVCVHLQDDRANCGVCGFACPTGVSCVGGRCACPGRIPLLCGLACVDAESDNDHCGGCGQRCGAGATCREGRCTCTADGSSYCYGRCIDTRSDAANCGRCYHACPSDSTCVDGMCTCMGEHAAICAGSCVRLWSDTRHCGACDHACEAFGACVDGVCVGRAVTPLAGERLGTRRPTFRWTSGDATVDVCADRDCTRVIESLDGSSTRGVTTTRRLEPGVYFWRLRARGSVGAPARVSFRVDARDTTNAGALPGTVDLNGDGLADVVVRNDAAMSVFFGARTALPASADRVVPLPEGRARDFSEPRAVGDLNNDGSIELEFLRFTDSYYQRVTLVSSPTPTPDVRVSDYAYERAFAVDDINDDGLTDWLSPTTGMMTVASGRVTDGITSPTGTPSSATLWGIAGGPRVIASLGDVDGDGALDVALAAPNAMPPRAYVLLGSSVGFDRTWTTPPAPRSVGFGAWVASAGDVNGDGHADLLAGYASDAGAVMYLGGDAGLTMHRTFTDPSGDALVVASGGDVDGDGYSDLVVLRRARDAQLYRGGRDGLATTPVTLTDARWRDVETLHSPGDIDGDGFDDLVAGAPWNNTVYVFHGAASDAYARVETLRGAMGSSFGRSVL